MAADLTLYVEGPPGAMVIQAEDCLWCDIGSANLNTYSSSEVDFTGSIAQYGQFDLSVTITGDSTCNLNLNGQSVDTTYTTDGNNGDNGEIVIAVPNEGSVAIYQWASGTRVDASFAPNIWIGAESSLKRRKRK